MTLSISKFAARLFAALLTVASVAPALHAQIDAKRSVANVPFAFEVGSQHFAAGTYSVSRRSASILAVSNDNGAATAMTRMETDFVPASKGKLVFRKVGDRYFLSQVWNAGSTEHMQCVPSSAETRAHKQVLAQNQTPATSQETLVAVASR